MPLSPRERVPYSAIVDRRRLTLPSGARLAVWLIVNAENWEIRRPMPRAVLPPPMGAPLLPDLPNWAWHEYGMRVGFWRIHECLSKRDLVPTLALNGSVCALYPRICEAARDAGWEFMGHGHVQMPMHGLEDQRASIRRTIEVISSFTGRRPRGWESPGLTETLETVDLLAAEGIEYVADWVLDDQPCRIATEAGSIISIPYTVEMNDVAMMAVGLHASEEWLKRGLRQFQRLYEESGTVTRIMSISVHPYLSGVPHRIGYLEELLDAIRSYDDVVFMTGEQLLDWYLAESAKAGGSDRSSKPRPRRGSAAGKSHARARSPKR
jgi:peptidoglycan/xylan/chitin deacetylase (PgdA/CDA1 family)